MMQRRILFLLLSMTMLLLASCGGSGKSIALNMREFSFSPDQFTVEAGAEVTLNIKNIGTLDHNMHIMLLGNDVEGQWEEGDEALTLLDLGNLGGGESTSVTFTAPDTPGTYQFVCSVLGHVQQGMMGTMTVTAP